jgi:hypothetical protein
MNPHDSRNLSRQSGILCERAIDIGSQVQQFQYLRLQRRQRSDMTHHFRDYEAGYGTVVFTDKAKCVFLAELREKEMGLLLCRVFRNAPWLLSNIANAGSVSVGPRR